MYRRIGQRWQEWQSVRYGRAARPAAYCASQSHEEGYLADEPQETLSGFPTSQKLDELRDYFTSAEERSSLGGGHTTPRRKATTIVGEEAEDEWSTWDQNWERVIYQGILARR